jgi:hypothetical protein
VNPMNIGCGDCWGGTGHSSRERIVQT